MIEVPQWDAIERIAVINTMVAGGEIIGFTLIALAFIPLIKFLMQEREEIKQERKDLLEAIRVMRK